MTTRYGPFQRPGGTAGVLLDVDGEGNGGYFLRLDPALQVAQFGKVGGYRSWYVDQFPELDRPRTITEHQPVQLRILVDRSAVVVYLDDQIALSARMYHRPRGYYGLFADGTEATFEHMTLHPWDD